MREIAQARTLLFVPGTRPDRFAKAAASGADGIICDLEDAVAPDDKDTARKSVISAIAQTPGIVRINSAETPWYADDLAAVAAHDDVTGVLLPKADDPEVVAATAEALGGRPLLLLIESARGIRDIDTIAQVPGVSRLIFGNLDYALDAGVTVRSDDEDELLVARSRVVIASRAADLPAPLDGVIADIDNDDLLRRRTTRALDLGFGGRVCIHPRQIDIVHDAVRPSDDEIAWAQRIVETASASAGAAVKVDGQMVDRPVLVRAERIIERA
ncbi:HpcH/HpaI aldolase/citrate lyase family protein [Epidermidibacterium keratini]|uniref:HpcH/HpaI aldolase/citrate lyase family protein n=1 Tax=Epidermidibacterium keratini TaxID=1891644 RepID=A0A7L4YNE9_9ACTN|nr:CoA ester lyase [Epidermidibacterium keratini]QHC00680.1 HpcH/HpaI aldolase/citrate lyase family protein [Epidermidibacterium keratini]